MGEWDPSKASSGEIPHSTKNETQTQYLLIFLITGVMLWKVVNPRLTS